MISDISDFIANAIARVGAGCTSILAAAFHVSRIAHRWERGVALAPAARVAEAS